jgi:hypothetical protein
MPSKFLVNLTVAQKQLLTSLSLCNGLEFSAFDVSQEAAVRIVCKQSIHLLANYKHEQFDKPTNHQSHELARKIRVVAQMTAKYQKWSDNGVMGKKLFYITEPNLRPPVAFDGMCRTTKAMTMHTLLELTKCVCWSHKDNQEIRQQFNNHLMRLLIEELPLDKAMELNGTYEVMSLHEVLALKKCIK